MKLPNAEEAIVAEAKIKLYLLSETHEDGKHKAAFFIGFGFSVSEWEVLAQALLAHAATYEVASTLDTPHGTHYALEGPLETPAGRTPLVRSVWAVDRDSKTPRLITAYPLKDRGGEEP